ncbi:hypothetical protein Tco_0404443 [Tanacetum coccineum]
MGDENPIRTLGDYSKLSHKGYRNTIELPVGNNVEQQSWNDPKIFVKPVQAFTLPQDVEYIRPRLIELESSPTLDGSSSCSDTTYPSPSPQPQVRDYMAAHTKRMERFENTIFKQREEINGRMTEMFGLLKELTTSRTPEKVLIREEAEFPVTKNLNSISLTKGEEGGSNRMKVTLGNIEKPTETETPVMEVEKINEVENGAKLIKTSENKEAVEAPGSQPVAYYLKHKINEKQIKGLVNNNRFNSSRSRSQAGKKKGK